MRGCLLRTPRCKLISEVGNLHTDSKYRRGEERTERGTDIRQLYRQIRAIPADKLTGAIGLAFLPIDVQVHSNPFVDRIRQHPGCAFGVERAWQTHLTHKLCGHGVTLSDEATDVRAP